jgi:hypothetical protein
MGLSLNNPKMQCRGIYHWTCDLLSTPPQPIPIQTGFCFEPRQTVISLSLPVLHRDAPTGDREAATEI